MEFEAFEKKNMKYFDFFWVPLKKNSVSIEEKSDSQKRKQRQETKKEKKTKKKKDKNNKEKIIVY